MPTTVSGLGLSTSSISPVMGSHSLGKDDFLKLLLAQLANQDPTAPTDNQQFVAQLAQFSSLEQAQATNSRLDSLLIAQASANQTAAASFIGKTVTFNSSAVALDGGSANIQAQLAAAATSATITLSDAHGRVVRTITKENLPAGSLSLAWNGLSDAGTILPDGTYTVKIEAKDAAGSSVTVKALGTAKVSGVKFADGVPQLIVQGLPISMGDVLQISESSSG